MIQYKNKTIKKKLSVGVEWTCDQMVCGAAGRILASCPMTSQVRVTQPMSTDGICDQQTRHARIGETEKKKWCDITLVIRTDARATVNKSEISSFGSDSANKFRFNFAIRFEIMK